MCLFANVVLVAATGCQSITTVAPFDTAMFDKKSESKKVGSEKKVETREFGTPVSMAVVWTDSSVSIPGKTATRGLGGRFFFYDEAGETTTVDGELTIYGFDDSEIESHRNSADKKFVFRQRELQRHASENDLGISYSFWIPWDAVGGNRKTISVLPVLRTANGKIVKGEISVNVLPGKTPESNAYSIDVAARNPSGIGKVQNVSYLKHMTPSAGLQSSDANNRKQMMTSTINLPEDLGHQMLLPQTRNVTNTYDTRNVNYLDARKSPVEPHESTSLLKPSETVELR